MRSASDNLASAIEKMVDRKVGKANRKAQSKTTATITGTDGEGKVWVRIAGAESDTPISKSYVEVADGDIVGVSVSNGKAVIESNISNPSAGVSGVTETREISEATARTQQLTSKAAGDAKTASAAAAQRIVEVETAVVKQLSADEAAIGRLQAENAEINVLVAQKASIDQLQAAEGRITSLESDHVSTTDLTAVNGEITNLKAKDVTIEGNISAATGRISDLESDHVSTDDLDATNARIGTVEADYLKAADMQAESARVDTLLAKKATVNDLNAATGRITTLESTKANISDLEANYITADDIEATYMHANMSNSDVAWIQNGVIANGAISSAMINDVSANKLTAGTINGSVINVTNLNADNITAGTINGQRIGEGSLSLDKLSEDVYTEAEVDAKLSSMQAEIDGAIETWTGTEVPTLNNAPASNWTDAATRHTHVGDVYFNTNTGYNYRFTETGTHPNATYSWLQIRDTDITNALKRIEAAEGQITTFDSDISTLKTDTGTLTTRTTSLEGRVGDAEDTLSVTVTDLNEVSDTVEQHSQTIQQHTTAISNKADTSTVNQVTSRVSKNEQDISGINTTIGELTTTVESKADGSELETVSSKLNTVSDTVDGHTQTISSVQSTLNTKADSTTVSTLTERVATTESNVSGITTRLTATESVANGVRADFDNLEIGGRNLLLKTKGFEVTNSKQTGWNNATSGFWTFNVDTDGFTIASVSQSDVSGVAIRSLWSNNVYEVSPSDEFTASMWIKVDDVAAWNWDAPLIFEVYDSDGKRIAYQDVRTIHSNTNKPTFVDGAWVYFTCRFAIDGATPWSSWSDSVPEQADSVAVRLTLFKNGSVHYKKVKLERGNKPTDWTPAPEDLETEVTSLKTDYATYKQTTTEALSEIGTTYATKTELGTETSNRQTAIQQANDAIALKANSTDVYTKTQADGKVTEAVNAAKAEIKVTTDGISSEVAKKVNGTEIISTIRQSAEDVKIKASQVEIDGTAIFSAISDDVDDAITDKGYQTASQVNSAITSKGYATTAQAQGYANTAESNAKAAIPTKVSQLNNDSSFATTTQVSEAVDAIEVGGRNLLRDTDNWNRWSSTAGVTVSGDTMTATNTSTGVFRRSNGWFAPSKADIYDKPIVISFEVKKSDATQLANMVFQLFTTNKPYRSVTSGNITEGSRYFVSLTHGIWHNAADVNSETWTKVYSDPIIMSERFNKAYTEYDYLACYIGINANIGSASYRKLKVELGNKTTDWTPAPEDMAETSDAVKRTQRIYYRKSASGAPAAPGTASSAWVTNGNSDSGWTKYNAWSTRIPPIAESKGEGATKYLYLYTCEQREMGDGTLAYTTVLLDDTTTVIDGGNIITGSVAANQIAANAITADKIAANAITIGKVSGLQDSLDTKASADSVESLSGIVESVSTAVDETTQDTGNIIAALTQSTLFATDEETGAMSFSLDDELSRIETAASDQASELTERLGNVSSAVSNLETSVQDDISTLRTDTDANLAALNDSLSADIAEAAQANKYIYMNPDVGVIIGESDGPYRQVQDASGTHWQYEGEDAAYVGAEDGVGSMFLEQARVTGQLRIGNYAFTSRDNGDRMSLRWIGE